MDATYGRTIRADEEVAGPSSKPPEREVSHNGRDWIPYERLTDSDAFDSYKHRRVDGVVAAVAVEANVANRVIGRYHGERQVANETELSQRIAMDDMDDRRRSRRPARTDHPPAKPKRSWYAPVDDFDLLPDAP
jgi:hypothetical protein